LRDGNVKTLPDVIIRQMGLMVSELTFSHAMIPLRKWAITLLSGHIGIFRRSDNQRTWGRWQVPERWVSDLTVFAVGLSRARDRRKGRLLFPRAPALQLSADWDLRPASAKLQFDHGPRLAAQELGQLPDPLDLHHQRPIDRDQLVPEL
jgi:hypothetical protein